MWNFSDIMRPKMATCMYSCMHVCAHVRYDMSCRQNSISAKWNIFLSFGLKVPFGFPCLANVCLSNSFGFVCFSTAYVTLVVALLFLALYFCLPSCKALFNLFPSLRCSTLLFEVEGLACFYTSGWTVFLILRLTHDCIFFPGKAHAANSRSASSSLVRMNWFSWGKPLRKWTNREIAFVFCFGLPLVWESSTKLIIHRSHSCNFFYHSYSRILEPNCNSSHITKAIAIDWGVKSSLNATWWPILRFLRSPSVLRVWAAIPSEYMALSQTFSVTAHMYVSMFTCMHAWMHARMVNSNLEIVDSLTCNTKRATQSYPQSSSVVLPSSVCATLPLGTAFWTLNIRLLFRNTVQNQVSWRVIHQIHMYIGEVSWCFIHMFHGLSGDERLPLNQTRYLFGRPV